LRWVSAAWRWYRYSDCLSRIDSRAAWSVFGAPASLITVVVSVGYHGGTSPQTARGSTVIEERCDVVVVGLGAMGAATLYQLAKSGIKAVGIDRYLPPHDQGSSHGDTRITRLAVGEGAAYIPLVRRSHEIWRQLEAQTGDDLFEQCGVLVMTSSEAPTLHHGAPDFTGRTIELARKHGIAHEVLRAPEIRARFPQFAQVRDDAIGYFEAAGGYVRPERCIATQLTLARSLGAKVIGATVVTDVQSVDGTVRVAAGERSWVADKAIVCAGMWSAGLLGGPFKTLLKVCRQTLFWFQLEEPVIFADASPSFILAHGPSESEVCYGFPPIPGEGHENRHRAIHGYRFPRCAGSHGVQRRDR
jgi:glycine/D-amino acid oxidase-like deaminating enzyme